MNNVYPLDCLREASGAIYPILEELPKVRQLAEQCRASEPAKALELIELLAQYKADLAEQFAVCACAFEELEQKQLAQIAAVYRKALASFDLMTPDYTQLVQTIHTYLQAFPDLTDEKVTAQMIGHCMNQVRMGYYKTDIGHMELLSKGLCFPEGIHVNLFDPCCGCGEVLQLLSMGRDCQTYGVEIDRTRAEIALQKLDRVAFGTYFHSRISNEAFQLLFLNPPYLWQTTEAGAKTRHEKRFLAESISQLAVDGILIYIIPYYRLTKDIARILCDNFTDLSVYRFTGKEFERFRQVAILGKRQKLRDGSGLLDGRVLLAENPDEIPCLTELPEERYPLPSRELTVNTFKGSEFNVAELEQLLRSSGSIQAKLNISQLDTAEKRPPLPFSLPQVGLIGGSGCINGYAGGKSPHIIKGRIVKSPVVAETILSEDKKKRPTQIQREVTHTNRLTFSVLTQDGFRSLS